MRSESTERSGSAYPIAGRTSVARERALARRLWMIPGRSFFPIATLVVILGSVVWGPWVSLALTAVLWFAIDSLENSSGGGGRA